MDIEVRVPATVANLGPGFDCLGVAVGRYLRIRFTSSDRDEVTGKGKPRPPNGNLTFQAFRAAFQKAGSDPPTVRIETLELYPSARGLGASASAIVAGLVAARQIGDLALDDHLLIELATGIEGHSDNVLPALFGGLVLNAPRGWMRFQPSDEVAPVVLVAPQRLRTEEARAVLPKEVPREDAVANAAATAALVTALTGPEPTAEALILATEDRLHEPYRLRLMPESLDLQQAMRSDGIACALAGAGPSLICLVDASRLQDALEVAGGHAQEGWQTLTPGWDLSGAQIR
jgi:homoserine kinase